MTCGKLQVLDMGVNDDVFAQNVLENAVKNFGGIYLENHGVPDTLMKDAFRVSRQFFELPKETKLRSQKKLSGKFDKNFNTTEYHGYTRPSEIQRGDTKSLTEFREAFDVCGSKRFYPNVPEFDTVMEDLDSNLICLAKRVCRKLAICLNKNENYFLDICKNLDDPRVAGNTSLRSLYYPAIPNEEKIPEMTTRCGAHTDFGMFTLLLQDNAGGLMVQLDGGQWIPVKPIPGAILLIMGNLWEEMTGYPALNHRVDFPEDVTQRKIARQSMTYFVHPDADQTVKKNGDDGIIQDFTIQEITMEKAVREGHRWKTAR